MSSPEQDEKSSVENLKWGFLRARSIAPGGFGDERVHIWPKLLHAEDALLRDGEDINASLSMSEHSDERQIKLDTDRSFVLYPVDESNDRESLQEGLRDLLVTMFRRHPKLNYFQGYHDVMTVLFLTLPSESRLPCAEKMSLHRLRDAMGTSLEPIIGQLRILQNLLRAADAAFAAVLESASPLPYYALSNLLTLFSHDVPTLPLIQHVFDFLLCRPPVASVYLAAAILLTRKDEVLRLEQEGEEGMVHSLLSGLPELYEEGEESDAPTGFGKCQDASNLEMRPHTVPEIKPELHDSPPSSSIDSSACHDAAAFNSDGGQPASSSAIAGAVPIYGEPDDKEMAPAKHSPPSPEANPSQTTPPTDPSSSATSGSPIPIASTEPSLFAELQNVPLYVPPLDADIHDSEERPPSPAESSSTPRKVRTSLTALLTSADALYEQHPPSHPALALRSIMGPQSVIFTWSEDPAQMPDDEEAEAMVLSPELIVLPPPPPPDDMETDGASDTEKEGKRRRRTLKKPKPRRRRTIYVGGVEVEQRKMLVAGAVLVLGVALAIYGRQVGESGRPPGHGHLRTWTRGGVKKIGRVVFGAGERLFEGLH
ncbi:hypothetical protein PUNSTDRAFT_52640 [Punctularia strigosozonata HHB-11173 SS5]|uniref:uncharacterized protein n=1 Tax=Punctularia strigosozonata (strain HHB-11173) TaxID=741275 RepID=UPI0004417B84|nr:uncharacterized protein PUNSTDRAFT_52640 [Punctularia strigosozonata HHB-11173 SS5]EIN08170.1 hypothetical protein PUNSTDRAFT_52640 [Punctularia strigosozonata HHB-11173 SS5]